MLDHDAAKSQWNLFCADIRSRLRSGMLEPNVGILLNQSKFAAYHIVKCVCGAGNHSTNRDRLLKILFRDLLHGTCIFEDFTHGNYYVCFVVRFHQD